jgi:hypothetical protein
MKLLIDECLSEELTKVAQRRGHAEASHVVWIGKRGWKDWELKSVILDGDWTFVTRNSEDFRGPRKTPGSNGQYAEVELHAGLICVNGPARMDLDLQRELFKAALDEIERDGDLVNQVLEISMREDGGEIEVVRYKMPVSRSRFKLLWVRLFEFPKDLLAGAGGLRLYLRICGERVDHFAGLGVVELFAGFVLDGFGIGLEVLDAVAQAGVVAFQILDLAAELLVFGALLVPDGQAVFSVDHVPGEQQRQADSDHRARRTPHTQRPAKRPLGHGAGLICFSRLHLLVLH